MPRHASARTLPGEERLTEKQVLFCEAIMRAELRPGPVNATQCYVDAGYKARNRNVAGAGADRLLNTVKIQRHLSRLRARHAEQQDLKVDALVAELKGIAFTRMDQLASWDEAGVRFEPSSNLPPDVLTAVKKIRATSDEVGEELVRTRLELELHGKLEAIEKLLRLANAYPPQKLDVSLGPRIRMQDVDDLDDTPPPPPPGLLPRSTP